MAGLWLAVGHRPKPPAPPPAPIPVRVATVAERPFPILLTGLGSVQALNTVTVRSRIDGQIVKVAYREGQDVQAGDVLIELDARALQAALDQTVAAAARDQAQLANARLDLERDQRLTGSIAITPQQVQTQQALVAQLTATVQADDAAIANARVQLSYATIRSPIAGRVGLRQVDEGNLVRANDSTALVTITQVQPIAVLFTVPGDALPDIAEAMAQGPRKVTALSRDGAAPLGDGTLAVFDNQIDANTATIRLKAVLPNQNRRLWPGQFVQARLELRQQTGPVAPATALQAGAGGTIAFAVRPDGTAEQRTVTVAAQTDTDVLIKSGLEPGEQVVIDGQSRLQTGARVAVQAQPPSPPASGA